MKQSLQSPPLIALAFFIWCTTPAAAGDFNLDTVTVSGDFRFRAETDFDSIQANAIPRDDRTRLRIRARAQVGYKPSEWLDFAVRARSGNADSQQSPHITIADFDDNPRGDADAVLDKYFARYRKDGATVWVGRNSFPFFNQNELFWDDDVTLTGGAVSYKTGVGDGGSLTLTGGGFLLPAGMWDYVGHMFGGQALWEKTINDLGIKASVGGLIFDGSPGDPDGALLLQGNGARDYALLTGSLQINRQIADRPLRLGADFIRNVEDYDNDPDPFTAANADENTGFVASATYGDISEQNHWLAGYYYARIEQFAVNNSYSQDDWLRFGSATQTRSSNFKGHEFRLAYAVTKKINLVARLYLVEAITTVEDGNRFRLDFNAAF